jgi:hypothetical protein
VFHFPCLHLKEAHLENSGVGQIKSKQKKYARSALNKLTTWVPTTLKTIVSPFWMHSSVFGRWKTDMIPRGRGVPGSISTRKT